MQLAGLMSVEYSQPRALTLCLITCCDLWASCWRTTVLLSLAGYPHSGHEIVRLRFPTRGGQLRLGIRRIVGSWIEAVVARVLPGWSTRIGAKLLAGEVAQPGTPSLRTLSAVKTLRKEGADPAARPVTAACPARLPLYASAANEAVTVVVMPPRALKAASRVIRRGRTTAIRSSRMRLVTFS